MSHKSLNIVLQCVLGSEWFFCPSSFLQIVNSHVSMLLAQLAPCLVLNYV